MSHEPRRLITIGSDILVQRLAIAAPDNEACCFEIGQKGFGVEQFCIDMAPAQCVNFEGLRQGPGSDCSKVDCNIPNPGACCLDVGGCINTTDDNCSSPDTFHLSADCSQPFICDPDCWYETVNCCPGGGIKNIVAVPCQLANLLASVAGPQFVFACEDANSCYQIDIDDPNTIVANLNQGQFECTPSGGDIFDTCEECCTLLNVCPAGGGIDYCMQCDPLTLNPNALTWTADQPCEDPGGFIGPIQTAMQCEPEASFWEGNAQTLVCPGGATCQVSYQLLCDGLGGQFPGTWLLTISVFQIVPGNCGVDWSIQIGLTTPRTTAYPGPATFSDPPVFVNNIGIESFVLELPWETNCF